MPLEDKNLTCSDCGKQFTFTKGEQEFYEKQGFTNPPKRCPDCRSAKKAQRGGGGGGGGGGRDRDFSGGGERKKYPAVCSRCGTNFEAPFQPKGDRPVFCRECFQAVKRGG